MRRSLLVVLLWAATFLAGPVENNNSSASTHVFPYNFAHPVEKRARRAFIVRCCGKRSCQGPARPGAGTPFPTDPPTDPDAEVPTVTTTEPPPIACAQLNFAPLASCCQLHPTIFDYMDPDIRTCTNKTSVGSDFAYYKSVLTDYMLNQAVTMKNKLDLRRVPQAVKFAECFFTEREWVAPTSSGEVFHPAMVDEYIDNVDASWDDLLTDALVNCSKVIKALVPWPSILLPSKDDPAVKQSYQTYPLLTLQCMRKVLLSYCPAPNKPNLMAPCPDLRAKFKTCDPFQQTADPPEPDNGDEEDNVDDNGDN